VRALLLVVCALAPALAGCGRREAPAAVAVTGETRDAATDGAIDGLPRVRVLADIAAHGGQRVIVEGFYEVDRLGKGKGGYLTWIVLADGTRISRSYGARKEEMGFVERQVRVTGVLTAGPPDPMMQSLMAPHIRVEKIELAPGQTLGPDTEIPVPPMASSSPALGARVERWVQIVGTIERLDPSTHSFAGRVDAILKLGDGTLVRVEDAVEKSYAPLRGKQVTVIGRLSMEKGTPGPYAIDLVVRGKNAVCPGVAPRCDMD